MMRKKIVLQIVTPVFFVLFFIFSTGITHAQEHKATLTLKPSFPMPHSQVRVELNAYTIDFDTALVTWRVDGEVIEKVYSKKIFTFTVGGVGTKHIISVSVTDGKGNRAFVEKSFTVSGLDIVWEGKTYTHPFYKGRSLLSRGAQVVLQALPKIANSNGVFYNKDELSYIWTISNGSLGEVRGKGMHSVILDNMRPNNDMEVSLVIKDPSGTERAFKTEIIPITPSVVKLYERNPLVGIRYDTAIGTLFGIYDGESTLIAEPYYMSADSRFDNDLEYEWIVDGNAYTNTGSLTFGSSDSKTTEQAKMNLVIKNREYWLQNARVDTNIEYGVRNTWGIDTSETNTL